MSKKPRDPLAEWHKLAAESVAGQEAKEKGPAGFLRRGSRKAARKLKKELGKKVTLR